MIITSKRKLTSSVAILCALMILIGIFPMNLFSRNKADAANSWTVYFDISNTTWFANDDCVPEVSTNNSTWNDMTLLSGKIYSYTFDSKPSSVYFARGKNSGGNIYGKTTEQTISDKNYFLANLWVSDSNSSSINSNTGTWKTCEEKTIYIDISNNTVYQGKKDSIYLKYGPVGSVSSAKMEYFKDNVCKTTVVLFGDEYIWFDTNGNWENQTSDDESVRNPGSNNYFTIEANKTDGKYKGTWSTYKTSLEGKTINFKDMTGKLNSNITAIFTGDGITTETSLNVTNNQVTIPNDIDSKSYTTVEFKNGNNSLGKYNLLGVSGEDITGVSYNEGTCNTFYYGAVEKISDGSTISYWGAKPSAASSSINSKKLYLENTFFDTTSGNAPTITINDSTGTFTKDSDDDSTYSYTINTSATQQNIISVTYNNIRYNFLWGDLSKNKLSINGSIASISDVYSNINGLNLYFDATLSKLSYENSTASNATMPAQGDNQTIFAHLFNNSKSTSKDYKMEKLPSKTIGSNTWSDVYYVNISNEDLNSGNYDQVVFSIGTDTITWPGKYGPFASQTEDLNLPKNTNKTCFYADSSDKCIYNNNKRSGYWDKVYTIRDAESGKSSTVVDIKESSFSDEKKSYKSNNKEVYYVNSTFYDYYTDFELNGSNRDSYGSSTGASYRNWVNFRQFDQALSDYYENKGVSKNDAIYTGHFQPTYGGWGYPFETIANTLNLYAWDQYNTFMSNNNSNLNSDGTVITGTNGYYKYATQGIVNSALENGVLKTHDGKAASPYFDEGFLNGNNSKNTKLGEVYNNVSFPFTKKDVFGEGVDYWWFDSASTTLAMQKDSTNGNYYLADHSSDSNKNWSKNLNSSGIYTSGDSVSNTYGLFPFNYGNKSSSDNEGSTYNYGYGTKLEFKFRLTEDGKVLDSSGNKVDIKFLFSGDDDVWVYIDGKLALDVGGDHGQVTGMLNFANGKAYVSNVKKSANNNKESGSTELASVTYKAAGESGTGTETYKFYQSSDFTLSGSKTDEHTLVMYYMERGMWESNMKVAFNFPDENQLEVEKQVDTTDVNEMFKDMFNNKSLFTFDIKNLATHYGPKSTSSSDDKIISFASDFSGNISTKAGSQTTANKGNEKAGQSNVFYYKAATASNSEYQKYTESRMATFKADGNKTIDISDMNYLNFKFYSNASYEKVPNYSIYIRLTDANGKVLNGYLSSECLYGSPSLTPNKWHSIKVIFRNLSGIISRSNDADFDYTKLASISFENTDKIQIWLDDFTFQPKPVVNIASGFQTAQKDIPDYGSATSGKLEDANGSQYTSSVDNKVYSVSDGQFVLQNKENVIFHNQFRNGSYISLKENLTDEQKNLFDTKWTIYEDNVAISTLKDKTTLYIDDGRTEPKGTDEQQANNNYNGNKPSDPTIVFKSYSDDSDTTPKLKIVYNNKVKTTNLTITKQKSSTSADLTGTYEFYVVFGNVGGIGLGTVTSPKYSLKVGESVTITGIPVGTNYTIHEIDPTEADVSLDKVLSDGTEIGFGNDSITVGGKTYQTNSVNGSAGTTSGKTYSYVFQNAKKPTIALTLKKIWSDIPDDVTIPINISVKLLRSNDGGKTWSKVSDSYNNIILDGLDGNDWQKTISGLDEYTDNTQTTKWTYKLVELDSSGDEIAEGNKYLDKYIVSYGAVTSDTNRELTVTNKYNVQDIVMPETGGEGGSPNQFNFVLFGAIAIALAGGLLLLNKKYAFVHIGKSSKEVR